MTVTAQASQQAQALEVTGKMAAVPALAAPILELLKAAGDDPGKLAALTARALEQVKGELPVVASGAKPADWSLSGISADRILKEFAAIPATEAKLAAHRAISFSLTLPPNLPAAAVLIELLNLDEAVELLKDFLQNNRLTFPESAPAVSRATFFPLSNWKSRSMQDAGFKAAGLNGFADDIQATLICAALVRKATDAGIDPMKGSVGWDKAAAAQLKPEELDLLAKLRDGEVRISSGFLSIDELGRLHYYSSYYYECMRNYDAHSWAAGAAPAAKLKK